MSFQPYANKWLNALDALPLVDILMIYYMM